MSPRISCVGTWLWSIRVECLAAAGGQGGTAEQPRNLDRPPPYPAHQEGWLVPVCSQSLPSSLQEIPFSAAREVPTEQRGRVWLLTLGEERLGPCCLLESELTGAEGKVQDPPNQKVLVSRLRLPGVTVSHPNSNAGDSFRV